MADFNNDGLNDLIVGAPGQAPARDPQSGVIFSIFGSSDNLEGDRSFDQESFNLERNEAGDSFGQALAIGDFNNDNFADLIVGTPNKTLGNDTNTGVIFTFLGSSNGLTGDRILNQESLNLANNEDDDFFGQALAVGDFNNDNFDDLIVGTPGKSPNRNETNAGAIFSLFGSSDGLISDRFIDQETLDLERNEAEDAFGQAFAVGDFNNDGIDDLAIGAPGETPGRDPASGAVYTLLGSENGLVEGEAYDQDDLDTNEIGDAFGRALAVGDFNNDGFDDLVIGAPREAPGEDPASGAVYTLIGSSNGLVEGASYNQATLELETNELGDAFGQALAVGDFNNDGFDDLVIGAPGEISEEGTVAGAIYLLQGSRDGLITDTEFSLESLNLDTGEIGDFFGAALSVGDFDNDGFEDLVVSAPGEIPEIAETAAESDSNEEAANTNRGAIYLFRGSRDGLEIDPDFDRASLDLDDGQAGDLFGAALASSRREEEEPEPPFELEPLPKGQIGLFRIRNTAFDTGTYLFVGEAERDSIFRDPDLRRSFVLEGGGNRAFVASAEPTEDTIPLFRLRSLDTPGTYLFVSTEEYDAIFAEDSPQNDRWVKEGLNTEGVDIPEFYVFDAGSGLGSSFNRFQNTTNNTFLFAGPEETSAITKDDNLSSLFINQGTAFESL